MIFVRKSGGRSRIRYNRQGEGRMKIIKRNGSEETFDINKIVRAVTKADVKAENEGGC